MLIILAWDRLLQALSAVGQCIGLLYILIESPLIEQSGGFIEGRWVQANSGATLAVHNPATGEHLADVPNMGAAETNAAIESASAAVSVESSLAERAKWLSRIHQLLLAEKQEPLQIATPGD